MAQQSEDVFIVHPPKDGNRTISAMSCCYIHIQRN